MKVKKGDTVFVTSGKNKGKTGKIIRVFSVENRVTVEGVNMRVRHMKPRKAGQKGQRIEKPVPLAVANVKVVCPKCGKPARTGYRIQGSVKQRICKRCGAEVS